MFQYVNRNTGTLRRMSSEVADIAVNILSKEPASLFSLLSAYSYLFLVYLLTFIDTKEMCGN
jgi:hypothetical protein